MIRQEPTQEKAQEVLKARQAINHEGEEEHEGDWEGDAWSIGINQRKYRGRLLAALIFLPVIESPTLTQR